MSHHEFKGTIRSFRPDGYERQVEIIHQVSQKAYWVSILDPENFIDPNITSDNSPIGHEISLQIALKLVGSIQILEDNSMLGILQPLSDSPHAEMVGRITKILGSDTFACFAGDEFPFIVVELEQPNSLAVDQVVRAVGELSNHA